MPAKRKSKKKKSYVSTASSKKPSAKRMAGSGGEAWKNVATSASGKQAFGQFYYGGVLGSGNVRGKIGGKHVSDWPGEPRSTTPELRVSPMKTAVRAKSDKSVSSKYGSMSMRTKKKISKKKTSKRKS